jgi:hypothetical protein
MPKEGITVAYHDSGTSIQSQVNSFAFAVALGQHRPVNLEAARSACSDWASTVRGCEQSRRNVRRCLAAAWRIHREWRHDAFSPVWSATLLCVAEIQDSLRRTDSLCDAASDMLAIRYGILRSFDGGAQ